LHHYQNCNILEQICQESQNCNPPAVLALPTSVAAYSFEIVWSVRLLISYLLIIRSVQVG
jgi:hypothetical protein